MLGTNLTNNSVLGTDLTNKIVLGINLTNKIVLGISCTRLKKNGLRALETGMIQIYSMIITPALNLVKSVPIITETKVFIGKNNNRELIGM